jgi:hypothetical protein
MELRAIRAVLFTMWICVVGGCVPRAGADGGDSWEAGPSEMDVSADLSVAVDARSEPEADAWMDVGTDVGTDAGMDAGGMADGPDAGADVLGGDGGSSIPVLRDAACGAAIVAHPILESPHVETDASTPWNSNPPSSGPHFGIWARWGVYAEPIPRGYLVHSLEHGAVVVAYRCANRAACPAVHDRLASFVRGLPPEPACVVDGLRRRIILTPDPLLDTAVAAAAWGHTYRADCVDEGSLETFVLSLTGRAPEDFCADGFYPPIAAEDAGADGG